MKEYYIYKIINKLGQIYIGQTVNYKKRIARYKCLDCKSQQKIYESIKNNEWSNHKPQVIYKTVCTKEEIDRIEIFFINFFQSYYYENKKYGLNMTRGGRDKSHNKMNEYRIKMHNNTVGYTHSEETREKISKSNKGKIPWCKGKKFTKEHVAKIIETKRRTNSFNKNIYTDEQRKRASVKMKGRIRSEEHCRNISIAQKKRKIQGGNKAIICYNNDYSIYKEYKCMKDAIIDFFPRFSTYYRQKLRENIINNTLLFNKYWKYAHTNTSVTK